MKITKTIEDVKRERLSKLSPRERANIGCDVCPNCGNKTITEEGHREWYSVKMRSLIAVDKYSCHKCGVCWESEPYCTTAQYIPSVDIPISFRGE